MSFLYTRYFHNIIDTVFLLDRIYRCSLGDNRIFFLLFGSYGMKKLSNPVFLFYGIKTFRYSIGRSTILIITSIGKFIYALMEFSRCSTTNAFWLLRNTAK